MILFRALFAFLFVFSVKAHASDSAIISNLLRTLQSMQIEKHEDFMPGQFGSYREYHFRKNVYKNDANSFYTGLVGFTLRSIEHRLTPEQRVISDSILEATLPSYQWFKNKKGRNTYNYWKTDPAEIFPNSGWLNLFNESQALPDDLDVSSIIMLAIDANKASVEELHRLMQEFANKRFKSVKNSFPGYKDYPAYSTWFGKKMPVDFDICVLANVLLMVNKYEIPYSLADSASERLIIKMVENRHHILAPEIISPYYARTPVILYHLARLMEAVHIPGLEAQRSSLILEAQRLYMNSEDIFDKAILSTALYRWGVTPATVQIELTNSLVQEALQSDFAFFVANIPGMLPRPLNKLLGKLAIGKFYYYAPAYNIMLLIENEIYREIFLEKQSQNN